MPGPFARFDDHEQVLFAEDRASGLRAIIAVHSTRLGPALGGTRFLAYRDEDAALEDALRLSRAMTYKAACAGLDLGGGKGVILGDPGLLRSDALLRAYGRTIASLGGRYVTAGDVGTTPADLTAIGRVTRWVTGSEPEAGGSGDSGPLTAYGVYLAMKAAVGERFGDESLDGRHVAVQGLGKVGARLVEHLVQEGARVTVADPSAAAVDRVLGIPGVEATTPEAILTTPADVLSPNALGGVLDADSIPRLQVAIVCGGANNQLAHPDDAERLAAHGVLYAPDYVVNAGGLINLADELDPAGHDPTRARQRAEGIPDTLREVFRRARAGGVSTLAAAESVAEERLTAAAGRFWLP